jgi:hypothetical protein
LTQPHSAQELEVMKTALFLGHVVLWLPVAALAGPPDAAPLPTPTITLDEREGRVTPRREGFQHTGAGNIDVAQVAPDIFVITMTGVAVAGPQPCKDSVASMDFDLTQAFEINLDKPEGRKLKLTMEARVIGLLRGECKGRGTAEESGCATIVSGPAEIVTIPVPAHAVAAGENLSINDHTAPVTVVVAPGKFTLHETFRVAVAHGRALCGKAWSAEFAPDPALDPLWISYWEPFHGASKKDFGFQVTVKVSAE